MRAARWQAELLLCLGLLVLLAAPAHSAPLVLTDLPTPPLGRHADYLKETGAPLDLDTVRRQLAQGLFLPVVHAVPDFGIGAHPVWLHIAVVNPGDAAVTRELQMGVSWLDRLDLFVVHAGTVTRRWQGGDELPGAAGLVPGLGYRVALQFAPGASDLYLRVASVDPMVVPIRLLPVHALLQERLQVGYGYGFFYGFLAALCAYNLLLFAGMGDRSHFYYALYLASMMLGNLAYTGHGLAWFWPDTPFFERYIILVQMVVLSCCGLVFANRFLELAEHAPRVQRAVRGSCWLGLGTMAACVLTDSHLAAARLAFSFMTVFTVAMVGLGALAVWQRRALGGYFLLAALCGMAGSATTVLAVWGWLPFGSGTYHALELGVALEATLLALALAYRMRRVRSTGVRAEQLARQDPLTGLYNRRAFMEQARQAWSTAERGQRPASIIMLDIDHFKQINDQHGHKAGDQALVEIGRLLGQQKREGDIVARWGGEEFVLLLPDTDLASACVFAERIRRALTGVRLSFRGDTEPLSASFGVAERTLERGLEEVINIADTALYEAKRAGRDRVVCTRGDLPLPNVG